MQQFSRTQLYPLGFQCGQKLWQRLELEQQLKTPDARQVFLIRQRVADHLRRTCNAPLSAGELQLWGLLNQMLSLLGRRFVRQAPDSTVRPLLQSLPQLFPPAPDTREILEQPQLSVTLDWQVFFQVELCLLILQRENRALRDGRTLFQSEYEQLLARQPLELLLARLDQTSGNPAFGRISLLSLLREPLLRHPDSLVDQVRYLRDTWREFLPPDLLEQFDTVLMIYARELAPPGPPGETPASEPGFFATDEIANFTTDRDWMPRTVLLAKAVFVWLDQLSRRYQRDIHRLDQIPDQELNSLRDFGFTGLWLIGIWQRSDASRRIKHLHGNQHVSASAYAIYDYRVADELGGEEALDTLNQRCRARGIHLACDVVTNHTGIDSQWMRQHPDWFIQTDIPPYPGYKYTGVNLSGDPSMSLQIENGYFDHSEAAVVFCRRDLNTGHVRYIYHGNDGTHLPWNDTAQLNFLLPEVREAMINVILRAAERFGIIRFDAAMTLAKKHFQRLWYPLPGGGEGVPSRSAWALPQEEFERLFPVEFWRDVVERIKAEQPDTLLVAEAFWLMEGYFVRTLGMHRVYNSAFMNMLKREENSRYRKSLREILDFDAAILQRFVNFMSNPDEETAVDQFGTGDKYFCVATLMCTLPGMPLFAHGQLEGLREKYGMEYTRAAWHEDPDQALLTRHWQQIAPLLRRRELFSGAENFRLYDFIVNQNVAEDVFVYTNQVDRHTVLVLCNNSPHTLQGRIQAPEPTQSDRHKGLGEIFQLASDAPFYSYRSLNSPLEYLRPADERQNFVLPAYGALVLHPAEALHQNTPQWQELFHQIGLAGRPKLDLHRRLLAYTGVVDKLAQLCGPEPFSDFTLSDAQKLQQLCGQPFTTEELLQLLAERWFDSGSQPPPALVEQLAATRCHPRSLVDILLLLLDQQTCRNFLGSHEHADLIWFERDALWRFLTLLLLRSAQNAAASVTRDEDYLALIGQKIDEIVTLRRLAEKSAYQLEGFRRELWRLSIPRRRKRPGASCEKPLKILFVSPEATPFAKTGGLADVAGSLPLALQQRGHEVRVILPAYRSVTTAGVPLKSEGQAFDIPLGTAQLKVSIRRARHEGVRFYFVACPEFFDRPALYGTPTGDYPDNMERFTLFCRAVFAYLLQQNYRPDILHIHDWQASLVPALLKTEGANDPFFRAMASLLTIHNLGYQGIFPLSKVVQLGLPPSLTRIDQLEYFGNLSLLKGGIVHADLLNTVSPSYCREIQQPGQGQGFDGLLRSRSNDLFGVLNGIDNQSWNPATDPAVKKSYGSTNLRGKRICKQALQQELGLAPDDRIPIFAVVSRLDTQKGIDLIQQLWPQLLQRELQFVLLGSGDQQQMAFWRQCQQQKTNRFAIGLEFDEQLSHRIFAGADCLLVPSRYEPCGLTQMIALRYGALPIVRRTGGLADTIVDVSEKGNEGNGFVFSDANPSALLTAIDRALTFYARPAVWRKLVQRGMTQDFSWDNSAQRYEELYAQALTKRRG
jgi:ADP-glucose type glycogen/starch synthase